MSAWAWIAVALLGGCGAIARFLLDGVIGEAVARGYPLGTFVVNISGAVVLGILTGAAVSGQALTIAGTATIGSYTTFSTWMLETHRLREDAQFGAAFMNVVLSLLAGLAAVEVGRKLGANL